VTLRFYQEVYNESGELVEVHHKYPVDLARIIHDGSLRNCGVALRDGRVEPRWREAYLKQYVDRPNGEPAHLRAETPHAGLSQQRIRNCSRSVHE
jgi:hypothetical protein